MNRPMVDFETMEEPNEGWALFEQEIIFLASEGYKKAEIMSEMALVEEDLKGAVGVRFDDAFEKGVETLSGEIRRAIIKGAKDGNPSALRLAAEMDGEPVATEKVLAPGWPNPHGEVVMYHPGGTDREAIFHTLKVENPEGMEDTVWEVDRDQDGRVILVLQSGYDPTGHWQNYPGGLEREARHRAKMAEKWGRNRSAEAGLEEPGKADG